MYCWRCGIFLFDEAFQWLVRGTANVKVPVCCDDRTCGQRVNLKGDKRNDNSQDYDSKGRTPPQIQRPSRPALPVPTVAIVFVRGRLRVGVGG